MPRGSATPTNERAAAQRGPVTAMARIVVLGGLDPSGGAGLTLDARVLSVHGCVALPVAAALTVQNRRGLSRLEPVAAALVLEQLQAALGDGDVAAIKTGLIGSADLVEGLAAALPRLAKGIPLVVDPVLSATAGGYEAGPELARAYREALAPLACVFTPNLPEAGAILSQLDGPAGLIARGCQGVLQKGGHGAAAMLEDQYWDRHGVVRMEHPALSIGSVRGTGCALASALSAFLARGLEPAAAARRAVDWLQGLLRLLQAEPAADGLPRHLPLRLGG